MDTVTQIQTLNEVVCISHTLEKGMNPPILLNSKADWTI